MPEKTMKSIPILLSVLAGTIFASCSREDVVAPRVSENQNRSTSQAAPEKPPVAPPRDEIRNWAIFAKADLSDEGNNPYELHGVWQPSDSDVFRVIQEARLHLERLKNTTSSDYDRERIGKVLAGWYKYACQVVGHTKHGKKLIHLSFFPVTQIDYMQERWSKDWRHH
jgi:hypothetical protein